jgi:hypothetical protein
MLLRTDWRRQTHGPVRRDTLETVINDIEIQFQHTRLNTYAADLESKGRPRLANSRYRLAWDDRHLARLLRNPRLPLLGSQWQQEMLLMVSTCRQDIRHQKRMS